MNQNAKLYAHLKTGRSITRWQAYERYGIANLWARISELEHRAGLRINRKRISVRNRDGNMTSVMRYRAV